MNGRFVERSIQPVCGFQQEVWFLQNGDRVVEICNYTGSLIEKLAIAAMPLEIMLAIQISE